MSYALNPDVLRAARRARGLTQPEFSDAVGVGGASRVSAWEVGQETPHPHQLRKLADVLGVPITVLLVAVPDEERDLRRLRVEAGLSISELAVRIHVAGSTLKRWERGVVQDLAGRVPIPALSTVLGVDQALVAEAIRRTRDS